MQKLKMKLSAVMLPLVLSACASSAPSSPSVVSTPQAEIPAPAAWAMTPASNSLQLLDELFSISEPASSPTGQK